MPEVKATEAPFVPGLLKPRPSAGEMMKKLDWLVGTWPLQGDFYTGDTHYPDRKAIFNYEYVYGGMFLKWNVQSHGPLKFYEAHALFHWDEEAQLYRGTYFDNFGLMDKVTMSWVDDNSVRVKFDRGFTFVGPAMKELRATFTREPGQRGRFLLEVLMNGAPGFQPIIDNRGEKLY